MAALVERVDRVEAALSKFMEQTNAMLASSRKEMAEYRARNAETDRQLLSLQKQADEDRARVDKEREKWDRHLLNAEKDRERWDRQFQQAEKERREFNRQLAGISDRLGTLIEDMVAPNAPRIAAKIFENDEVLGSAVRVRRKHPTIPGRNLEMDLVVNGRHHLIVGEAKSKVTAEKAQAFLEKVNSIPEFYPEYGTLKIVPLIASVNIESSMVTCLSRLHIYALGFGDETMELLNEGAF